MLCLAPQTIFYNLEALKIETRSTRAFLKITTCKIATYMPLEHNFGCEDTPKWLIIRLKHKFACANALHGPLSDFSQRGGPQN